MFKHSSTNKMTQLQSESSRTINLIVIDHKNISWSVRFRQTDLIVNLNALVVLSTDTQNKQWKLLLNLSIAAREHSGGYHIIVKIPKIHPPKWKPPKEASCNKLFIFCACDSYRNILYARRVMVMIRIKFMVNISSWTTLAVERTWNLK